MKLRDPRATPREEALPAGEPDLASDRLGPWLFSFGLVVYAATRFVHLPDFPIFFFTDEAVQANAAHSLYARHFRDAAGMFLPPYFLNDVRWAMSLNIYLLVLPIAAFGKSILVTRGTFAVVSLLGAAAAGGALRVMKSRAWWSPPLLLAAMPVDFLHSRVAFETTPACFAGFLFAYLLYRLRSPRYVFLAILLGAATFYSYTAGQGILLVMGVLLFLADFRYHARSLFRNPALRAGALALLLLAAVPFVREQRRHPHTTRQQLTLLNSYWVRNAPLAEKLGTYAALYARAFDPRYWLLPNDVELVRHQMKGMAYVPPAWIPLLVLGILSGLRYFWSSPGHRAILLSPLAVPFSAAVANLQILRVLPMIVPITLLSALGLSELLRRLRPAWNALASSLFAASLTAAAVVMTGTALVAGPTWYEDYGLYGLQYGARQVFDGIRRELARSPTTRVYLSSIWANNPEPFFDFFLTPAEHRRARMGDVESYLLYRLTVTDDDLFVMTADQYEQARKSGKLVLRTPERIVRYPDGRAGFYFVRFRYGAHADEWFAADREERRRLVEETVAVDGQLIRVRHSVLDMGNAASLFGNRPDDPMRGLEANPLILEFLFQAPRILRGVDVTIEAMECDMRVEVRPQEGVPIILTRHIPHPHARTVQEFPLPAGPVRAREVRIEIRDLFSQDVAHVELRHVAFR